MVKGGHLGGDRAPDVVVFEGELHIFDGPRLRAGNDHGTGCTLSAATGPLRLGPVRRAPKLRRHGSRRGATSRSLVAPAPVDAQQVGESPPKHGPTGANVDGATPPGPFRASVSGTP
jgi:hypothetical protein